jgi:hypothetical protein
MRPDGPWLDYTLIACSVDLFAVQIKHREVGASASPADRVALRSDLCETHEMGLPYLPPAGKTLPLTTLTPRRRMAYRRQRRPSSCWIPFLILDHVGGYYERENHQLLARCLKAVLSTLISWAFVMLLIWLNDLGLCHWLSGRIVAPICGGYRHEFGTYSDNRLREGL